VETLKAKCEELEHEQAELQGGLDFGDGDEGDDGDGDGHEYGSSDYASDSYDEQDHVQDGCGATDGDGDSVHGGVAGTGMGDENYAL
jgi:hypothetical protein